MATTFLSDVTDDFKKLYETKEGHDAIIIAGKEPNVKEFQVHSLILRTRSSYFHCAFSDNWAEKNDNDQLVLKKPNIDALVFEIILKYLYCGIVDFQNQKNEIILELLIAVDELGIQRFINSVQEFLIKNSYQFLRSDPIKILDLVICHDAFDSIKKAYLETFNKYYKTFLQQDPIKVLHFIIRHEVFDEIRNFSLEIICENPGFLFNSDELFSLEKDVLVLILNCDDLDMKEIDIWKLLIKWGIAQHQLFQDQSHHLTFQSQHQMFQSQHLTFQSQSDVTKFTHEDFKALKKTLCELIQLIRFHQINGKEFVLEVWPFRHLLPDNLIEDILRCYLISGSIPHSNAFPVRLGNINIKIDSIMINKKIALLFMKWIDGKNINDKNSLEIRYKFNLLFRNSNGFLARIFQHKSHKTFHLKCDNKGATIFIARISGSKMLIGGYNPLDWNGNNVWKQTKDSFIFFLSDPNNPQSAKLGRVTNKNYAVYCGNDHGPTFGGVDLFVPNNNDGNWGDSYPNIGIPTSFEISDYEMFQVVKN
ncbi:btb/poz domain-containing protein 19-like [Gigaspora margarita]|uniref:Btb/poz domain-containing protein 19-like n=1 Tax=Gigaspora margarita TaxID=4874 RepID=A0A8H4AVT1_GIGMA|nr:btb/poz domain-containing protein 19-like [Gigaspora margarita]